MGDIASLTQEEAAARSALLRVERYDIALDFTGLLEGDRLEATSTVSFTCTTPGASTFVDCLGILEHATLNGVALDLDTAEAGRLPLTDLAAENVLVIASHQDDTGRSNGILKTVDPSDKLVYVWTSFEPDDARRVFACFDQPDLKAVFGFTVTAPESWIVLSNSDPGSVTPVGESRLWSFVDTPRLSTYVVVVNAGPFHELRERRGGYDLGLYCRQSLVPLLERDAGHLFDLTEHGLGWYGDKFGLAFPQQRYDQVFVPNMGGAMENWGSITHGDYLLPRTAPSQIQMLYQAEVVLHEMAHMWFGDLVTMRWWDDLWLNEAFATWASIWCAVELPEYADAWAAELMMMKQPAYRLDLSPASHPIRAEVDDVAGATANFDAITYFKGMSVLRQLSVYVGEEAFLSGLQTYFRDHAWGNTVLDDLMAAIGTAAGVDLTDWTNAWLDHAGTDRITLSGPPWELHSTTSDGAELAEPHRPHRLAVASYDESGRLVDSTLVTLETTRVPVDLAAAAVHMVNAGDLTFASVRSDDASQAWLLRHAGDLPDVMARTLAVSSAYGMLFRGEATGSELIDCVVAVLARESSPALVGPAMAMADTAAELWTPPSEIVAQQDRLAALAAGLVTDHEHRLTALRALASWARTSEHLELLQSAAADDVDLAWRLLARRAELGDYDEVAVRALEQRDPDPDAWVNALTVRAARPDADAKEEAWRALLVDRSVPLVENFGNLTRAFWRPGQAALLADYPERYLDVVASLDGGMLAMMPIVSRMYPSAVATIQFLDRARGVAEDDTLPPVVAKQIQAANDVLARQLVARRG